MAASKKQQGGVSRFQSFEMETISRSQIKNAEYNPRIMDADAKKRLRDDIRKHGLVAPITWNKRTGNVVGGHQRLEQLDALERTSDYDLSVAVIDVSEREEAELNVLLNNPSVMGDWDMGKLADMTSMFDLSFEDMGFSELDVDLMFDGDERFSELYEPPEVVETKEKLEQIREERANAKERLEEAGSLEWYVVLVFADQDEREKFMRSISIPVYEQYVTYQQILRIKNQG